MKKHKTHKTNGNEPGSHPVQIEFSHPTATTIFVAGTFNEWRPGVTPMISLGNGRWFKELTLPAGRYEYRLLVDGEWTSDPLAGETAPNPFGGMNSVLRVPNGCEINHEDASANSRKRCASGS